MMVYVILCSSLKGLFETLHFMDKRELCDSNCLFCCSQAGAEQSLIFQMDLAVHSLGLGLVSFSKVKGIRELQQWGHPELMLVGGFVSGDSRLRVQSLLEPKACPLVDVKSKDRGRMLSVQSSALPETAASVAIAATVVGAAATFLVWRTKASNTTEIPLKLCEDCGGSGICPDCRGEGFVLKKLSEESSERARLTAKNMATRYTAGLPKKWSYCPKCSSTRSCITCSGRGKLSD